LLALVVAAAMLSGPLAESAAASHSWSSYHWARTTSEFDLQVGDNVSGPWEVTLDRAVADWSTSDVIDLVEVPGTTSGRRCRPSAGRVEVCNAKYGANGWLGLAQIWLDGNGHITQGLAKMNDTYFNLSTYDDPVKRSQVLCQEIGHTLGLDHQDESGADLNTCMDYAAQLDNPSPNSHDYAQLESTYAHLDGYNSYTDEVPSGDGGGGKGGGNGGGKGGGNGGGKPADAGSNWGQSVASAQGGHGEFFVRDLGNGELLVTHVIWVDGYNSSA
jgi:hypothetical protein